MSSESLERKLVEQMMDMQTHMMTLQTQLTEALQANNALAIANKDLQAKLQAATASATATATSPPAFLAPPPPPPPAPPSEDLESVKAQLSTMQAAILSLSNARQDAAASMASQVQQLKSSIAAMRHTPPPRSSTSTLAAPSPSTPTTTPTSLSYTRSASLPVDPSFVYSLVVFPSDSSFAAGCFDDKIRFFSSTGVFSHSVDHGSSVHALCVLPPSSSSSSSGGSVASGGQGDFSIKLWGSDKTTLNAVLTGHTKPVRCLAVVPDEVGDGFLLVSGSSDVTVRLWRGTECLSVLRGHRDWVVSLTALPGGRIASGSLDDSVIVWQDNGVKLYALQHTDWVYSLTSLPNGQLVSGSQDKTIKVWDGETCVGTLTGHTECVYSLASHNGIIASGSKDKSIRLWVDGACVAVLSGHTSTVYGLGFQSDGTLVSGSQDKTIALWRPTDATATATAATSSTGTPSSSTGTTGSGAGSEA